MGIGSKCLLGLFLGCVGGVLAWGATDFIFNPASHPQAMETVGSQIAQWGPVLGPLMPFFYGGMLGLFLCVAIGASDGILAGSRVRLTRSMVRGMLSGLLGGAIGFQLGNLAYTALGGRPDLTGLSFGQFLEQILIRSVGWTIMGALFGGIYGFLDSGPRKGRNGAIGGAIGGFFGGLVFNPVAQAVPTLLPFVGQSDRISRLIGFALLGAFLGFFTALIHALLKSAWVFVLYGKNEGKEIILDRPINRIGRNELVEIPVFRDRLLAANHAEIRLQGNRWILVDGGSAVGTAVNGQRVVQPTLLKDSDLIQLGNTQVVFYERATAGPVRRQIDRASSPAAPPLTPAGVCPFCGQQKEPSTGACACSVGVQGMPDSGAAIGPPTGPLPGSGALPGVAAPSGFQGPPGFGSPQTMGTGWDAPQDAAIGMPSPAQSGSTRLTALVGAHAGENFVIPASGAQVGRDAGNTIPLVRDTTVSRRHAMIALSAGGWIVTDLGSSNGTFVNGNRVTSAPIRAGDEVMFGTARFRFEG